MAEKRQPKTFFIKHKNTKRQQSEFDRLSVPLRHLPENVSLITITCPFCQTIFRPDWFKKHELSMAPVKPKFERKGVRYTGPIRWVLQQAPQKCIECGANVMINLPVNKMRTKGSLFGDDAERIYNNKKVSIYSLIGADQSLLLDLENKIKGVKQNLLPSIPQDSWKIHMKDMWAGNSRERHPVYRNLSFNNVINLVDQLFDVIKRSNLFIYNIAATSVENIRSNRKAHHRSRDEAYITAVRLTFTCNV